MINIQRRWAMPDANTFNINPIMEFIGKIMPFDGFVVDPFVRNSPFKHLCYSNDLDPEIIADEHMDALDFLKTIPDDKADLVLFDPPYSPRQVSECYKKMKKTVNMETTQGSFWAKLKVEISRITKHKGMAVACGWNSGGIGEKYGFLMTDVLMVAHGGAHNDTIITLEIKNPIQLGLGI